MTANSRSEIPWTDRDLTLDESLRITIYTNSYNSSSMGLTTVINNLILEK